MLDEIEDAMNKINESVVGDTMRLAGAAAIASRKDVLELIGIARAASRAKDSQKRALIMRAAKAIACHDEISTRVAYHEGVTEIFARAANQTNMLMAHTRAVNEHREKMLREM